METFRVLDPSRIAGEPAEDRDRPDLGYATRLSGMGWNAWDDSEKPELADFAVERKHEALMVAPVRFPGEAPDLEAAAHALASILDFGHPPGKDERGASAKPWKAPGREGLDLRRERKDEGGTNYIYHLRIARWRAAAAMVAAWYEEKKGDRDLVRRSMDAVELREPEGTPPELSSGQRQAHGLVLNQAGLACLKRDDHARAAAWFQLAFEQTRSDPVILENAGHALELGGRHQEGLDLLAPQAARFPDHHSLGLRLARLQVLGGDVGGGTAAFLGLIERGMDDEDELLPWLKLLGTRGHHQEALRSVEAWIQKSSSTNALRWRAQVLFSSGREKEAVSQLEELARENQDDPQVALDLGGYYNDTGEHARAAEVAEKLLAGGEESRDAFLLLGWSQMGRKWYRDAKATFERAAKKSPGDETAQDAIRQASAALGQGNNTDIKQPIEAVPLPPEVVAAVSKHAAPAGLGAGHSSAWIMRATGYRFEKGKPLRRTLRARVKVLTVEGAKDFSSLELAFDPLSERIFMNRLEVSDGSGKVTGKASLDDSYVRDLDDGAATHRQVLHMQVAGVQPGCEVAWEVTIEDRAGVDSFEFRRHLFATSLPVAVEAIYVLGEVGAVKAELGQGDELERIRAGRLAAWIVPALPAAQSEPYSVFQERLRPMLWLGGEEGTWEDVGREYLKQIQDRLGNDRSVEDLASSLVAGKTTEGEKIAALARHVQRSTGYKAIEFGVRARRPNAAADTLRLRYGDCKDHALLMHLLLRAAGIASHLALVNTGWTTHPALPTLDQFNHMILHVPGLGENWLLDTTQKSLDLAAFPADGLWHARALVLTPAGPRLLPAPGSAAANSAVLESRRTLTPVGEDFRVEETLTLIGYPASWMRGAFTGISPAEQRDKAQGILADQGAAQVEEFRFESLDDPSGPARLVMVYTVREALRREGARRTGVLPAFWERDYLATRFVKDRRTAFESLYPLRFTSEAVARSCAAADEASIAALRQEARTEFTSFSLRPEVKGADLILRFEFSARTGEHPAARYAAYHEAWEAARRAWEKPLSWAEK